MPAEVKNLQNNDSKSISLWYVVAIFVSFISLILMGTCIHLLIKLLCSVLTKKIINK